MPKVHRKNESGAPPKSFPSITAIGAFFGVSKTTVEKARRRFGECFPRKHSNGYRLSELTAFANDNSLWGHAARTTRQTDPSYAGVRIAYVIERTNREKLIVEGLQVEQQLREGNLLLADSVLQFHVRSINLVMTTHDALCDALDRALPEQCPDPETWAETRERILDIGRKLSRDVAAAMEEIPS